MQAPTLLERILRRGDVIAIHGGILRIEAASGADVPPNWLASNREKLASEALRQTGVVGMRYTRYSTGNYQVTGKVRAGGLTLQFVNLVTGENHHTTFNADLTRLRSTKYGKGGGLLPKGKFRVHEGHNFVKFWKQSGIPLPRRLSAFHECMGKLKGVIFEGTCGEGGRLKNASLKPVNMTHRHLLEAYNLLNLADKPPTIHGPLPDNYPTRLPDKELAETQQQQALQTIQPAGESNHGLRLKGTTVNGGGSPPSDAIHTAAPTDQTDDAWWSAYYSAEVVK